MKFLFSFLCFLILTLSAGATAKSYVIMTAKSGVINDFYEKFPTGSLDIVVADEQDKLNGKVVLEIKDLNDLYVAITDNESAHVLKSGKLPYEILRVSHYIFFKGILHQDIDRLLHAHDLKLIKISAQKKRLSSLKMNLKLPALTSKTNLEDFYKHTKTQFNAHYLKGKLEQITGVKPFEISGQQVVIKERGGAGGRENVRKYLQIELEKLGFKTWFHKYSTTGTNIVAQKEGSNTAGVVVLSAHIDSVGNAGADDDGTGVAALIATAKVFSTLNHRYSLRIVGYDQEEDGLVGSGAYFDSLAASGEVKSIVGAIHYDMTGWDGNKDGKFHILDCSENSSPEITNMMTSAINQLSIKLNNIPACRRRSDHIRYWQYSIPAVMAIEVREQDSDVNPCYHRACDTLETINLEYFNNMTQVGALTLMQMTGVELK